MEGGPRPAHTVAVQRAVREAGIVRRAPCVEEAAAVAALAALPFDCRVCAWPRTSSTCSPSSGFRGRSRWCSSCWRSRASRRRRTRDAGARAAGRSSLIPACADADGGRRQAASSVGRANRSVAASRSVRAGPRRRQCPGESSAPEMGATLVLASDGCTAAPLTCPTGLRLLALHVPRAARDRGRCAGSHGGARNPLPARRRRVRVAWGRRGPRDSAGSGDRDGRRGPRPQEKTRRSPSTGRRAERWGSLSFVQAPPPCDGSGDAGGAGDDGRLASDRDERRTTGGPARSLAHAGNGFANDRGVHPLRVRRERRFG